MYFYKRYSLFNFRDCECPCKHRFYLLLVHRYSQIFFKVKYCLGLAKMLIKSKKRKQSGKQKTLLTVMAATSFSHLSLTTQRRDFCCVFFNTFVEFPLFLIDFIVFFYSLSHFCCSFLYADEHFCAQIIVRAN